MLPVFRVYEIQAGWRQPVVRLAGPNAEGRAAQLWEQCHSNPGAALRAVDASGIEWGAPRPGDQHGVHGIRMERCAECAQMFLTGEVGAALCVGCELLIVGSATLLRRA